MAKLSGIFRLLLPLSKEKADDLALISVYLAKKDSAELVKLMKEGIVSVRREKHSEGDLPVLVSVSDDQKLKSYTSKLNDEVRQGYYSSGAKAYKTRAKEAITAMVAPAIEGMDQVKTAAALLLFADNVHMLLLGDPGTGKTDILRGVSDLSPKSSFGLGSGTSGAGLSVTFSGKEVLPGLLPMADGGICAIDELNLMEDKDRASLYNAMEKGFVSYSKGGRHIRFDAKVRVIATANPKGDRFTGKTVAELKKQMPFDPALLSRFHLVFLVRKPSSEEFRRIARSIVKKRKVAVAETDRDFVREYVRHARDIEVKVPKELEEDIVSFVSGLREREDSYLIEITPRLVKGFVNLAKASARMELRDTLQQSDVTLVQEIVTKSLEY